MSVADTNHPITVEPFGERLRVRFSVEVIADTARALVMGETVYPPIYYIPRYDAVIAALVSGPDNCLPDLIRGWFIASDEEVTRYMIPSDLSSKFLPATSRACARFDAQRRA